MWQVLKRMWDAPAMLLLVALCVSRGEQTGAAMGSTGGQGAPPTFSASGRVTIVLKELDTGRTAVTGVGGVQINFTRAGGTGFVPAAVSTDSNGNWSQSRFEVETTYKATPVKSGLVFTPAFIQFVNNVKPVSDKTGLNFEARRDIFSASGVVTTQSGRAVGGVTLTVAASRQAQITNSDAQGRWAVSLQNNSGTFRVTPSLENFTFNPPFRDFAASSATQLDFKLPDTFGIAGVLKGDTQGTAPPVPNATVNFELISGSGARPASVRSDGAGAFRQTGFTTGSQYRVKVVNSSGRVCATLEVKGERAGGRINCL